jgi:hypothetical protein
MEARMSAETPAYVAFCPTCNNMTACTVDDGTDPKGVSKFLAPIIRRGDRIERKTVGYVRAGPEWCKCERKKKRDKVVAEQLDAIPADAR